MSNTSSVTTRYKPYNFRMFHNELLNPIGLPLDPVPRSGHRLVNNDYYLYMIGGFNPTPNIIENLVDQALFRTTRPLLKEIWRYCRLSNTWQFIETTGTMPDEMASHNVLMISDWHLIVYGGTGPIFGQTSSNKITLFDIKKSHWKVMDYVNEEFDYDNIPTPAYGQSIAIDRENLLFYVCGGTTGFEYNIQVHCFDLKTKRWQRLADTPALIPGRYRHEMGFLNGKLFIIGGSNANTVYRLDQIPVFDIKTKKWDLITSKPWIENNENTYPEPRYGHDVTQIEDRLYVVGGTNNREIYRDVWCLNLSTLTWFKYVSAKLPEQVFFNSITITNDGELYMYGGCTTIDRKIRSKDLYRSSMLIPKLERLAFNAIHDILKRKYSNRSMRDTIKVIFAKFNIDIKIFDSMIATGA